MQSDLVSYQHTISRIESIIYFDTPAADVHHLKAEKVCCEERDCPPTCTLLGHLRALPPPAAAVAAVATVAALVSLPLLFTLRVDSILGAGIVRVVGRGKQ
jgi:hypothetical protein